MYYFLTVALCYIVGNGKFDGSSFVSCLGYSHET